MSAERFSGRQMSRRNMLMALGLGGVAAATVPVVGACGVGGRTNTPNGADDVSAEAGSFSDPHHALAGGPGQHDGFILGAYFIGQYGPAGWIEDLHPWLQNSSATGPDYDFEDIFDGLRTSTRWDFKTGDPLGTGGQ